MLKAVNIHKVYNSDKRALKVLKGVDLDIESQDFISIVGPSGAGKSTLLHILGGLDSPTQGEVFFRRQDIYRLKDNELSRIRNKEIGFAFQFYHLLSEFTVLENVLMPALINQRLGADSRKPQTQAIRHLEQVGLSERLNHFPAQLSGGERQRVAIARGLINDPSLFLCDEPTGNLDSKTGDDIISLIKQIKIKTKMAVILVTHNLELAKAGDKVYHLKDGILIS